MNDSTKDMRDWLGNFLRHFAHDIRSPARNTSNFCELIVRHLEANEDEKLKRFAELAHSESEKLTVMLNSALELSLYYQTVPKREHIALEPLLQNIWNEQITSRYPTAKLALEGEIETLNADAAMLGTLLEQLCDNACRFNASTPEVSVAVTNAEEVVELHIKDNGIGITPSDFDNACLPFRQLEVKTYPGGLGMGLAKCVSIMQCHNGSIEACESASGAHIVCKFPRK